MAYNMGRLFEGFELVRRAEMAFNGLDVEAEPLSYTEPVNRIIGLIEDAIEVIVELEAIIEKEA